MPYHFKMNLICRGDELRVTFWGDVAKSFDDTDLNGQENPFIICFCWISNHWVQRFFLFKHFPLIYYDCYLHLPYTSPWLLYLLVIAINWIATHLFSSFIYFYAFIHFMLHSTEFRINSIYIFIFVARKTKPFQHCCLILVFQPRHSKSSSI